MATVLAFSFQITTVRADSSMRTYNIHLLYRDMPVQHCRLHGRQPAAYVDKEKLIQT